MYNQNFTQRFESSIVRLTASYAVIFATILFLAGGITYSIFTQRAHQRFNRRKIHSMTTSIDIVKNGNTIVTPSGAIDRAFRKQNNPALFFDDIPPLPTEGQLREDLVETVLLVHTALIIISSLFGYFLAKRTLRPIKESYEKQQKFLADASHELRTPLAILHLDLENQIQVTHGETRTVLESNLQEVQRMSTLVNNLLMLSRLDQKQQSETSVFSIASLVQESVTRIATLAESHSVAVKYNGPQDTEHTTIRAQYDSIFQAINNCIHNAIVYNKKDGTVTVSVLQKQKDILVSIVDTGSGIAPEDVPHIFDRFYRADKSRTRSTGGSGLGLAIARTAIEKYGGTIALTSIYDEGTTVTISFPLVS